MEYESSYEELIVEKSDKTYELKDQLKTYGVHYNFDEKEYSNNSPISENILEELKWFLKSNDLKYTTKQVSKKTQNYKILAIDKNNFLIEQVNNNLKCYYINVYIGMDKNRVNILDTRKSLHLSTDLPKFETNDYLFEVLKYFTHNTEKLFTAKFDESELFTILTNIIDTHSLQISLEQKLQKFKFMVIKDLSSKNKGDFLCNCVPGFFPETEFKIVGNKILSSYTENFISPNQEKKIWKYLYKKENRRHIGNRKEPSLFELFKGAKIPIKEQTGNEYIGRITAIKEIRGKLEIKISNGISEKVAPRLFEKEELFDFIRQYR
jgi:hypothetical protein